MPLAKRAPSHAFLEEAERRFAALDAALAGLPLVPELKRHEDRARREGRDRQVIARASLMDRDAWSHHLDLLGKATYAAEHHDHGTGWTCSAELADARGGVRCAVKRYVIWCGDSEIGSDSGAAADFASKWNAMVDAEIDRLAALKIA